MIISEVIAKLKENKIDFPFYHIANSPAILNLPDSYASNYFNLVRPGIIIFGIYPPHLPPLSHPQDGSPSPRGRNEERGQGNSRVIKLKPALSLKSRVVFIKELKKGESVSYGRRYRAKGKESLLPYLLVTLMGWTENSPIKELFCSKEKGVP